MPSTLTSGKGRLEKQATGENEGTWGAFLNAVLDAIDRLSSGYYTQSVAGSSNVTPDATDDAQNLYHKLTGTLTGNIAYIVPSFPGFFIVENATTGNFSLTVRTSGGSGIAVTQGGKAFLFCDGTNVVNIAPLDITGLTAETSPAVDDELAIRDVSTSTNDKITLANLLKVLNALTEDTDPDFNADFLLSYDASAAAAKKVKLASIMPPGMVMPYAGTTEPTGWLFCYGQAVSRTTYAALFAVIGTTYGVGDGSTTFTLPDLRGRVVAGQDDMGGSSANRLTNQSGGLNGDTLGATGGAETHTLTTAEMPAHTHTHFSWNAPGTAGAGNGGNFGTEATGSAGGGAAHNNVQPTIILNYLIKV